MDSDPNWGTQDCHALQSDKSMPYPAYWQLIGWKLPIFPTPLSLSALDQGDPFQICRKTW